jgi:DnaK suppressor protein
MRIKQGSRIGRRPKATTSDIIGRPTSGPLEANVPPKWRKHYERLVSLREDFLTHQSELSKDALDEMPSFSTHMADAGTDNYDRDVALAMLSSEQDALYQIEQALDRIQAGTYGICELTGKAIHPVRLAAIPWTRFSVEAERQLERQGVRPHVRLGPRETVARGGEPDEAPASEEQTG